RGARGDGHDRRRRDLRGARLRVHLGDAALGRLPAQHLRRRRDALRRARRRVPPRRAGALPHADRAERPGGTDEDPHRRRRPRRGNRMTSVAVAAPSRTWLDRISAALPLATVFFWLCVVYGVEAWLHGTPWLFTDELELTQLSRAIAATGHAARRGYPHSFDTLYTYLLAPAWWI